MIAVFSLLMTLFLSLLVTRVAAMALMLTGISREMARFQARSAFTGCGFTTSESEAIVNHPVRRRILMILMLLGNLGIATVVASVMISLMQFRDTGLQMKTISVLMVGMALLWIFSASRWVERNLNKLISWSLRKFGRLEVRDYVAILQLQEGYAVTEMHVEKQDWLAGKTLKNLRLPDEGVLVLGIQRQGGSYLGAPEADTEVRQHDMLILYGPITRIQELDQRRKGQQGDAAHLEAVSEHEETILEQFETDAESLAADELRN
ncbi:MAG: TrkA C-terminal domain-containing protein [Planctomycetaceae bacterium]|nr:TrkA C-terminal domain-containing protein [Planctomycetaceae bacterium]